MNHRFRVLLAGSILLSAGAGESAEKQSVERRPNVVLVLGDYMGYGDTGPYGSTDIRTPHIDRLAREGVRLTNAYGSAPICSPSRTALLTGRYPQRAGMEENIGPPPRPAGLPLSETTLARMLKDVGYRTALFGKWHLGFAPEYFPNRHGFDEFFGFLDWTVDYYTHRTYDGKPGLYQNETPVEVEGYTTEIFTDRAVAFIEKEASRPFFLFVSYNAALPPHQPPGRPEDVRNQDNWYHGTRADYIKVVEALDTGVGRILESLDRNGLADDTLVIFTCDHGGRELGRTAPLFHGFRTLWEGGIRVPLILRWPGKLPAGGVSSQLSINMDLSATILRAAQTVPPARRPLDGIDLVPILQGVQPEVERTFFWRTDYSAYRQRAVRSGRFKYLRDDTTEMLFDLDEDIGERHNLAYQRPDLLKELQAVLAEWEAGLNP